MPQIPQGGFLVPLSPLSAPSVEASPGDRLMLPLQAPTAGTYELAGFFTRTQDYGIIRLYVNGEAVGSLVDGYGGGVEPTGLVSFGRVALVAAENAVEVELLGKDARSARYADGYLVGLDGFLLRE
jgi:arylsulfatase A